MNPQPWAYIDTMSNMDLEREKIERNNIFNKLIDTVEGEMHETDGWFNIYLTTGGFVAYKYVFRPHRNAEKPGESYFRFHESDTSIPVNIDIDTYLDGYIHMGPIYGAITMFVEHKLGFE